MIEHKIENLLLEKFKETEYQELFLIEISLSPKKDLEIILDADAGLDLGKCQRISRFVENWLDTEGVLGDNYTIEVSSPGVSRPLMMPRQYPKHIGRNLEVVNTEGVRYEGTLTALDADKITLTFEEIRKEGKKKIKEIKTIDIPFSTIKKALVLVKF
jgi:ribosome maturation factor RimP